MYFTSMYTHVQLCDFLQLLQGEVLEPLPLSPTNLVSDTELACDRDWYIKP